jgi:hypothetical protein
MFTANKEFTQTMALSGSVVTANKEVTQTMALSGSVEVAIMI